MSDGLLCLIDWLVVSREGTAVNQCQSMSINWLRVMTVLVLALLSMVFIGLQLATSASSQFLKMVEIRRVSGNG